MARFASMALVLLTALLLPGCSQDGSDDGDGDGDGQTTSSQQTTTASNEDPCPLVAEGATVPEWSVHGGRWGRVASMEGHIDVICGVADGAVQSLTQDGFNASDVEVFVSFDMLAGDSGAGVVIHFKDEQNFNIVRYSPREQGWHLFTMIDGNRQKQDNASVTPPTTNPELHEWVRLRVVSEDGHVTAYDGATKVIDYTLQAEASHEGGVGLFLRDEGMAALFDDFSAESV